jgi:proline iminopeptidase
MGLASDSTARLTLEEPGFQLEFARLVTHYWSNGAFLGETELIDHAGRLDGIPGVLIHGRFDVSSPVETPWRLSQNGRRPSWSWWMTQAMAVAR